MGGEWEEGEEEGVRRQVLMGLGGCADVAG